MILDIFDVPFHIERIIEHKTKKKILPSMAHINISATMATPRKLHIKPMKYIIHRVHNGIFVSSISGNTYPYLVSQSFWSILDGHGVRL